MIHSPCGISAAPLGQKGGKHIDLMHIISFPSNCDDLNDLLCDYLSQKHPISLVACVQLLNPDLFTH